MTDKERKILLVKLAKKRRKALKSKSSALQFLKEVGILTEHGNLKAPYKA